MEGKETGEFSKVGPRTGRKPAAGGGSSSHTVPLALGTLLPGNPERRYEGRKAWTRSILGLGLVSPSHVGKSKNLSELQFSCVKRI